MVTALRQTITG